MRRKISWTDGRTEVKQYTHAPLERGYKNRRNRTKINTFYYINFIPRTQKLSSVNSFIFVGLKLNIYLKVFEWFGHYMNNISFGKIITDFPHYNLKCHLITTYYILLFIYFFLLFQLKTIYVFCWCLDHNYFT